MTRAYSQSQGKFIDIPDTISGGIGSEVPAGMVTGVTGTTAPTPQAGGGQDVNTMLQQILLQAALKEPKYASRYSSILGMLQTINPPESEAEKGKKEAKQKAEDVISTMEDYYFKNKLHYGNVQGILKGVMANIDPNQPLSIYNRYVRSKGVTLAKAAGDVGNIAYVEQVAQLRGLASARQTRKSAIEQFDLMREGFGLPKRDYSKLGEGGLTDLMEKYGL